MGVIEQIKYYSPWWDKNDWYKKDKNLKSVENSEINFRHIKHKIHFKYGSINIIRGQDK